MTDLLIYISIGAWVIVVLCGIVLIRILKQNHNEKFNDMGKPKILFGNPMKTLSRTGKFLIRREHKELNDKNVSMLSDFMLILLIICIFSYVSIIIKIIYDAP